MHVQIIINVIILVLFLDGFGGFSTDGCRMVSDEREFTKCECDHLTSFCILLVRCNCIMHKL